MSEAPKEKWYFKNSFVITAFVVVGPLALPLVWFNPRYSQKAKILTTVVSLVISYFVTLAMIHSVKSILEYYRQIP